eukprot:TRINITY_DN25910_c0_g3_i1.p2 TRINITY_DN25910_c0_g3~~TRINITY_DN25910_c0_g3_i1.p2  ORF type:complete len:202 (-),score=49.83 TRINITY_DN25910_c0_g3_i1:144-749(-)
MGKKAEAPAAAGAEDHKLETPWTLWVEKKSQDRKTSEEYMEGLKQAGTFRTVEEFLRLYAFVKRPGTFPRDHSLLCFREGKKPMWEEFPDGGCWNYRIRRTSESEGVADAAWEGTLLACLGEAFATPDVMGCVLSSRPKEIAVSVWNASNAKDPQVRFKIGERWREQLGLGQHTLLEYKDFQSSIKDFSSYRNARAYIMQG